MFNDPRASRLEEMTTEELEQLLRADAAAEVGEADPEMLQQVMDLLAQRRRSGGDPATPVEEAYTSFQENYMSAAAAFRRKKSWLRGLSAAAAVLVVVVLGSATAGAFGYDVWGTVAKWTQDLFYFSTEPTGDTPAAEMLSQEEIVAKLFPTWVPEGYTLESLQTTDIPNQRSVEATYRKDGQLLRFLATTYLPENPLYTHQSGGSAEVYETGGICYYIFPNLHRLNAAWLVDGYECHISGILTVDEMKQMIDSIPKE